MPPDKQPTIVKHDIEVVSNAVPVKKATVTSFSGVDRGSYKSRTQQKIPQTIQRLSSDVISDENTQMQNRNVPMTAILPNGLSLG